MIQAGPRHGFRAVARFSMTRGLKENNVADLTKTRDAPREQLFDEIARVRAGMLGIDGGARGPVPMSPHLDRESKQIYFFTRRSSQLVMSIGQGAQAEFLLVGKDQDYYASLTGPIVQSGDSAAIDRHWNALASAWFPGGRDDPELTLLQFTPNLAEVWASTDSSVVFAWEVTKALVSGSEPDVGVTAKIGF
jgi:general stress protein 26